MATDKGGITFPRNVEEGLFPEIGVDDLFLEKMGDLIKEITKRLERGQGTGIPSVLEEDPGVYSRPTSGPFAKGGQGTKATGADPQSIGNRILQLRAGTEAGLTGGYKGVRGQATFMEHQQEQADLLDLIEGSDLKESPLGKQMVKELTGIGFLQQAYYEGGSFNEGPLGGGGGRAGLSFQEQLSLLEKGHEYQLVYEKMRIEQSMRQLQAEMQAMAAQMETQASLGVLGEMATHATEAIVPGQEHYYGWQPGGAMSQLTSAAGQQFTPRAAVGVRPPWEMPLQQAAQGAEAIRGSI